LGVVAGALGSVVGGFIYVKEEVLAVVAACVPSHVVECCGGYLE
jgi:hypothetical protein